MNTTAIPAPFALNLQRLCVIRIVVLSALTGAALYASLVLQLPLPYPVIYTTLTLVMGITLLVLVRLHKPWPVTDIELFAHLLLDILSLTVLIYFTGGASNPIVSYYLVPLTISAATLPWCFTWSIAIISTGCYSLMMVFYVPLEILAPHHHDTMFNPHLAGMWLTFVVSALLITYFVVKMAQTLRERERALNDAQERAMHNEQIIGIATLAAGTAHKLGTPLSTMAILLTDLKQRFSENQEILPDIDVLRDQLNQCKNTLHELSQTAQIYDGNADKNPRPADLFVSGLIERWRVIRPDAKIDYMLQGKARAPGIIADVALEHAIQNLLNNAADASPKPIQVTADWTAREFTLKIKDYGPGIPLDTAEHIGKPFYTTKMKGLGLGLFLSHATINRYGGSISLYNHNEGGTLAEIVLPVIENNEQ